MLSKKIIWELNIIDLLLLFIILLSVAALIYKSAWGKSNGEYKDYTMTFVCENLPIELLDKIETGSECIDAAAGDEIGELINIECIPYEAPSSSSDFESSAGDENDDESGDDEEATPTPAPTQEPTHAKAMFTVRVGGAQTDHGIRIDTNVYLIGQNTQIIIENSIFDVYISDIY